MTSTLPPVNDPARSVAFAAAPFLTRGVELSALLEAVVLSIVQQLKADRGTLYLADGAQRTLTSLLAHLPELDQIRLDFDQGIAGTVASTGRALNVPNPLADSRFDPSFDEQTGYKTSSLLAVPIKDSGGAVIAVLQLLNAETGTFSEEDERLASELAVQAGKVLESTSLYANLRQAAFSEGPRPALAFRFNHIVGQSPVMNRVYELVEKAARTDATVLIQGESGTGKELIARAVHVNSPRKSAPFIKVDCTTLPEALIENELFGHERGAFTGADRTVPGKVEVAEGGTLFIDEIGELPLKLQGKLLRVLQDREFERVGGTKTVRANIRVICATHRDLAAMVDAGSFREDLYYRVRVVPLTLPPLRERGSEDLRRLIEHFVQKFTKRHGRPVHRVAEPAMQRLLGHDYPGNIRELEHCIESAVVLCEGGIIEADDLPLPGRRRHSGVMTSVSVAQAGTGSGPAEHLQVGDPNRSLAEIEHEHIKRVVDACSGNQSEAARKLGIGRNTLARKLSGQAGSDED
ncbi:MAG: sigma-54-dependent Fis family transcriptional regulator [Myxococcota bacterium]